MASQICKNYTKATIYLFEREALISIEDEEGQRVVSSIEPGNKVEFIVVFENGFFVKKTTVYLVYDEPTGEKVEHSQEAEENAILFSGDENKCSVGCPEVQPVNENVGADSFSESIKHSFRQWITNLVCGLYITFTKDVFIG